MAEHGVFYIAFDANGDAIGALTASSDWDARHEALSRWGRDSVIEWRKASDRLRGEALALTNCLPREYMEISQ